MSDLASLFQTAQDDVVKLNDAPDVATKLKLYSLFKQAAEGDATGDRPSAIQFVARAKFDAWTELKGMSGDEAKQKYIDLVTELKANDE
ncbi:acyl-CoA-binding protein [Iodobacter fluviatilis]|uniref:Acyl-CoA-binding protein n=1 Tax=Iodobacter fluviatilis TaxID=537 RepID=A0A377SV16_9NEIS|nr:acyl-CoA-binding protein [Iodobacter fluviatilis]TCU83391.1 acyl-CoA-binding protein [Iodobacter fluviatilis]STR45892.1 Acyl-CoA-binding protein [Iodobacter fluviatilis]